MDPVGGVALAKVKLARDRGAKKNARRDKQRKSGMPRDKDKRVRARGSARADKARNGRRRTKKRGTVTYISKYSFLRRGRKRQSVVPRGTHEREEDGTRGRRNTGRVQ